MAQKLDLYQTVTDKVIAAIEAGAKGEDWQMPWISRGGGFPKNAVTGKRYRGMNVILLFMAGNAAGYRSSLWASYRQWQSKGAQVRKGETGTMVVFYRDYTVEDRDDDGNKVERRFPVLRYSKVFNADQVDGFEVPAEPAPNLAERIDRAEAYVAAIGADIRFGLGRAFYRPSEDYIGMPDWADFKDTAHSSATENAYSTLFHELTHWTGAPGRCDRDFSGRFGDQAYAAEELVAELGAAFVSAQLGITHEPRADHAQYLEHWLKVLRGDKKAIFTAASKAAAAVDYLDGRQDPAAAPAPKAEAERPAEDPVVPAGTELELLRLHDNGRAKIRLRQDLTRSELERQAAQSGYRILSIEPPDPEPEPAPAPTAKAERPQPPYQPGTKRGGRHGFGVCTVDGVTYHKRWNWTREYSQHFRAQLLAQRKPIKSDYLTDWYRPSETRAAA